MGSHSTAAQMTDSESTSPQVKFVNSTLEILQSQMKKEDGPKKKRTRTSPEQLRILQKAFSQDPMPNAAARLTLAKKLGMNVRAVQVWFQNRRAKGKLDQKRQEISMMSGSSSQERRDPEESSNQSFRFKLDRDTGVSQIPSLPRSHSLPADFNSNGYISATDGKIYPSYSSQMGYFGGEYATEYVDEFQSYNFTGLNNEYTTETLYPDNFEFASLSSSVPVETDIDGTLKVSEDLANSFQFFGRATMDNTMEKLKISDEYYNGYSNPLGLDFHETPYGSLENNEMCRGQYSTSNQNASHVMRRCFSSPDVHHYLNAAQIEQLQQFDREAKVNNYRILDMIPEGELSSEEYDEEDSKLNEHGCTEIAQYISADQDDQQQFFMDPL